MNQNQRQNLHRELIEINHEYINLFNDYRSQTQTLSKKKFASIISQIFGILQQGTVEQRKQSKEALLGMFRDYISGFIECYITNPLQHIYNEHEIVTVLLEKWKNYKKFVFFYSTIFQHAHHYYESAFLSSQSNLNSLDNPKSIFPISAIAMQYFHVLVYDRYRSCICREIMEIFRAERNQQQRNVGAEIAREKEDVKSLLEIVYSCGLKQMARISSYKNVSNHEEYTFLQTSNKDVLKSFFRQNRNPQQFFQVELLSGLTEDARNSYIEFYEATLSQLSPVEDFTKTAELIEYEKDKSEFYFFTNPQKLYYQQTVTKALILTDLSHRLTRDSSFKFYLQQYNYHSDDYLPQIKLFMRILSKQNKSTIKFIEQIISNHLMQNGNRITQKLNKRKQYIQDLVELKKSINNVIDQSVKDIRLSSARDKCFRKILDSVEASRNLADYTDGRIKQCIKGKLNEEQAYMKIKDVLLILENLVATDSFLMYHQEMLAKRLLEGINEPKIEYEMLFLKQLAEKLGNVSVSAHINMVKDIENSQQLTEMFVKRLPFVGMRWGCRIISPPFWPENLNRNKLEITMPQAVRLHAETVASIFHESYDNRYLQWRTDKGYSLFEGTFPLGKFRFQSENLFINLLFHIDESRNHQILFGNLKQKVKINRENDHDFLIKCVAVLVDNNLVTIDSIQKGRGTSIQNGTSSSIKDLVVSEGDVLRVNSNYTPKQTVKPNQTIIIRISAEIHKAMHDTSVENNKIQKQREKIVEAVLVKLLKHSHSVGNNSSTFLSLLHGIKQHHHLKNFNFSEAVVKQRLEQLIHRGYCERDENNSKIYRYLA